ncbi:hypothetical protein [Roseobacter sp.]|uniref:hypothetical protein n=1 Tax=Roseobacter sp. TaxID=1907202 RepID=UPI00385EC2AB
MKMLLCALFVLWPFCVWAQSKTVLPSELSLQVEVEKTDHTTLAREMVIVNIKGVYRRHITLEQLVQPDLEGFSWTQLGNDTWREERLNGEKVKTFSRRMALFPDQPGELTIGAFTHSLTLTDERDDWFEHDIASQPVVISVAPAPADQEWWFPVRSLKVSDQWSNAPDQLVPGEGVLRVVRIEALGVTPEMIPPMPTLHSPSAMIFPHPEKRFVELSPDGPLSYAFWRWTIRPSNDTSTIVEPLSFDYFDTANRIDRSVTISAQRVAYGSVVPDSEIRKTKPEDLMQASLPGWPLLILAAFVCVFGVIYTVAGRQIMGLRALHRFRLFDPLARQMRHAAQAGDLYRMRRTAAALLKRDGPSEPRKRILSQLDQSVFGKGEKPESLRDMARSFLTAS